MIFTAWVAAVFTVFVAVGAFLIGFLVGDSGVAYTFHVLVNVPEEVKKNENWMEANKRGPSRG